MEPGRAPGNTSRKKLSRQPQVYAHRVRHVLIIDLAWDDHKRAFLDLVLLPGHSELGPLGRIVVAELP
jgi:hypothetical protein